MTTLLKLATYMLLALKNASTGAPMPEGVSYAVGVDMLGDTYASACTHYDACLWFDGEVYCSPATACSDDAMSAAHTLQHIDMHRRAGDF